MEEKTMRLKDFPDWKPTDSHNPETIVWPLDQARQLSYLHPRKEFLYIDVDPPDQRTGIIVSIPESS